MRPVYQMHDILQFMGNHPILSFLLALILCETICYPFKIANRYFRSKNIASQGWPPTHLDADGDPIKKDDE